MTLYLTYASLGIFVILVLFAIYEVVKFIAEFGIIVCIIYPMYLMFSLYIHYKDAHKDER